MGEYNLCNDYIELIAGTNNVYAASYLEAANNIKKNNKVAMGYLKNFITSIENIANKSETKDKRISDSKGNIKQFDGYENIQFAIEFIQKNLSGLFGFRELVTIHDKLIEYQTEYQDGYSKRCRMVMLEYDNALYLLVTGLSMLISNNMEVIQNGSVIKIQKTNEGTHGVIAKAIKDMATQLSDKNHKIYLDTLNKEIDNIPVSTDVTESVSFMESDVLDFLQLIDRIGSRIGNTVKAGVNIGKTIIKSAFGIIPLIRSIMYLRYKKKADTINALDEQCAFIKLNIDQLNNRTNMDPKKKEIIIKKQAAVIERYQKKAAKLRAELMEQEKDATIALEKENPELKKTNDDFVLEGVSISEMFQEYDELPSFNELFEESFKKHSKPTDRSIAEIKSLRKNAFKKQIKAVSGKSELVKDSEYNSKIEKCIDQIHKATAMKTISFKNLKKLSSAEDKNNIHSTKIGGTPYWPESMKWPTCDKGPLTCIAQINFAECPKLPGYPSEGILQFFIWNDEVFHEISNKNGPFQMVYHKDINQKQSSNIQSTTFDDDWMHYGFDPFNGALIGKLTLEENYINFSEESCFDEVVPIISKIFGINKFQLKNPDHYNIYWDILDKMDSTSNAYGTRIGGHPYFIQSDDRSFTKGYKDSILLLQIDSEAGMMFGDAGIINFFIKEEDLARKKFDKVLFAFACC